MRSRGWRTSNSMSTRNPLGRRRSRSTASRRTAKNPLVGSVGWASLRGNTALAMAFLMLPAGARVAMTRSTSLDRPTSASDVASWGGCRRSPSITTIHRPCAARIPVSTAPTGRPSCSPGAGCTRRTGNGASSVPACAAVVMSARPASTISTEDFPMTCPRPLSTSLTFWEAFWVGITTLMSTAWFIATSCDPGPMMNGR